MNYLEMFIVVLAVILFTTAALVHHRSTMAATENLANATYRIQATQLAHEVLDQIDARLINDKGDDFFGDLAKVSEQGGYEGRIFNWDLEFYGASFEGKTSVALCDSLGNDVGTPGNYRRVDVTVEGPESLRHPVKYSRVFTTWNQ
jgi:HAMP domain-containing protein